MKILMKITKALQMKGNWLYTA